MNLFILNKDEAVQNIVKQRVSNKFVAGFVGTVISNLLSDDNIADKIGQKITELVPIKLSEFGVKSFVEVAFQQASHIYWNFLIIRAYLTYYMHNEDDVCRE